MTTGIASEPPLPRAAQLRVLVPFTIVTLIWSSTWIVIRAQLGEVPASWSIAYRFMIAGAGMFAYALATRTPLRVRARDHGFAAIVGISLFAVNFHFVYAAEGHITSGLVALVFALLVVPNAVFAWLFLGQGVSRRFIAGSVVAVGGLVLLFWHELDASPAGPRAVLAGVGLTLGSVLSASIANVMQATRRAKAMPTPTLLAWAMAYGALGNSVFALATVGAPTFDPAIGYVAGVLYLGIVASTLAFPLYAGVIQAIGPGRAAYSSVLVPVLAMTISTLFEDYRWGWQAATGVALVIGGLLIAIRAKAAG